jgi:hypothetical protein
LSFFRNAAAQSQSQLDALSLALNLLWPKLRSLESLAWLWHNNNGCPLPSEEQMLKFVTANRVRTLHIGVTDRVPPGFSSLALLESLLLRMPDLNYLRITGIDVVNNNEVDSDQCLRVLNQFPDLNKALFDTTDPSSGEPRYSVCDGDRKWDRYGTGEMSFLFEDIPSKDPGRWHKFVSVYF